MARMLLVLTALCGPTALTQAQAEPTNGQVSARALFEQGVASSKGERWEDAAEFFRRSLAVEARPVTYLNLGIVSYHAGRYRDSVNALDSYLATATPAENADDRREAVRLRELALQRVAWLTVKVKPSDVTIEIDGVLHASTGPERDLIVSPGPHQLVLSAGGFQRASFDLVLPEGSHRKFSVALQPTMTLTSPPPRAQATGSSVAPETANGPSLWQNPWLWGAVGVIAVGAITTAIVLSPPDDRPSPPLGGNTGVSF